MKSFKYLLIIPIIFVLTSCGNNNGNLIEESGTIEATTSIISSEVNGKIDKIIFDEGSLAGDGDTVVIIDSELYEIKYKQALALKDAAEAQYELVLNGARNEDIVQAEETVKQAKANYELAKVDKERYSSLYEEKAITKKQHDDMNTKYDISLSQFNSAKENLSKIKNLSRPEEIKQAKANLNQAEANLNLIEKNINDCYITSPFKGYVVKNFVEKGEFISPMSSLFKIADLSEVELSVFISETDLGKVKLGDKVDVTTDSFEDKTYEGTVIFISPEAEFTPKNIQTKDERTKLVFEVKIKIPNPDQELKPGMPADAVIVL